MKISRKAVPFIFVLPSLLLLLSFGIYPLIYTITLSFKTWNLYQPHIPPSPAGLKNFLMLLGDAKFLSSIGTTASFAAVTIPVEFICGFAAALLLNRIVFFRKTFRTLLILPMTLASIVVALMWKLLYNPDFGLINYFLGRLGVGVFINWLGDPAYALFAVSLTDIWQWTPFILIIILAGLQSLPEEPFESAVVDGANGFQLFFYLTLPLLKNTLFIAITLRALDVINEFDKIYVMTFGGPGYKTQVLGLYLYRVGFRVYDIGYLAALSLVVLLLVVFLAQVLVKMIRR